ncbi:MAG: ABC transporter permease [Candidatus Dependentiae bacterium]
MIAHLQIFLAFLWRDFYVYSKRISFYLINYTVLYPLNYIITFGYLVPKTIMHGADNADVFMITLLSGNVLLIILNITFNLTSTLLYDRETTHYIDFQITRLGPSLILLEHIIFNTLFAFVFLSPFFFICKIILGESFDTNQTSWAYVILITFLSCLCIASYTLCAICIMKSTRQISSLWIRVNIPLFVLGGFWVPWFTIFQVSNIAGYIVLLNPFIYVTEGLRRAITGSELYFSIPTCVIGLLGFSFLFYITAYYSFNKKMDPVS